MLELGIWSFRLRLHDWRNAVFRVAGVEAVLQFTMANAVEKIDDESDCEPNDKTNPRQNRQAKHERDAEDDAENRKPRDERNTEGPRSGRLGATYNDHT